jgi:hypothetical protein
MYFSAEKHSPMADIRNAGFIPHLDPTNFRIISFLVIDFFCVFHNDYCM